MTVKVAEKKIRELEHRLKAVELGLWPDRRLSWKGTSRVWEETHGKMSKAKAIKMLRELKQARATANR